MIEFRLLIWLWAAFIALQSPFVASVALPKWQNLHERATLSPYSLAGISIFRPWRTIEIFGKRIGWSYGPPVAGGPAFPTGTRGSARVAADGATVQADARPQIVAAANATRANVTTADYNGLQTLDDYTLLYEERWQEALPQGPVPGMLTNYTQDLLFSMERLSLSPFQIRRLDPRSDKLQFSVDDEVTQNLTGMALKNLFDEGRLFYADYRDQLHLKRTERYAAACDAYFYIDQSTGDFLPLAIRTNIGPSLIYTPNDRPEDWLLAKIMYNVNDLWFAQWNHLASTHEVVQIVYLAAIRTLSDEHPVLALLDRTMYQVYAIQPLAQSALFANGTVVDQHFPFTGTAAQNYTTKLYQREGSGRFEANYFVTDLMTRGLINSTVGPRLKNFPFYEDGSVIHDAISTFMTSFVDSYYPQDSDVEDDDEIQAWVTEAQGPAKAIDFPSIRSKHTLVEVLTHLAHLVSVAHHAVNTNELVTASTTLPFHPMSLYQPPPTAKNASNLVQYLPPLEKCESAFTVATFFARPEFVGTNRTLIHMFDDPAMLSRMNGEIQQAAATFMSGMQEFSRQVGRRSFDENGLSQGMPFVWRALDPNVAPYSITI